MYNPNIFGFLVLSSFWTFSLSQVCSNHFRLDIVTSFRAEKVCKYNFRKMHIPVRRLRSPSGNARKVNCGCVYSAYILKPVFWGRNL